MSTSIDTSFIKMFDDEYKLVWQRTMQLRETVRVKSGVRGADLTFQKLGKGSFASKARHGATPPMNLDHTKVTATIVDKYGREMIDSLDMLKQNVDERSAVQKSIAMAGARNVDDQIIAALDTSSTTPQALTLTSGATVRNSLLGATQTLLDKDVPWDGNVWGVVSPRFWMAMMTVEEFTNADYRGPAFPYATLTGAKSWMGVHWMTHTGLPKSSNTRTCFLYHKWSLGYAEQQAPTVKIDWENIEQAWSFVGSVAHGAVLIDDDGVLEMTIDESTALPTT